MSISILCPQCQRKNQAGMTHCAYCGIQFAETRIDTFATKEITEISSPTAGTRAHCAEYLADLAHDEFVLFVNQVQEPIIVQQVNQIIVGRHLESLPIPTVDLAAYNAVDLGVSRRHAQISFNKGAGTITDLGSTNGTWLNQRLLTPGIAYPLNNDDQLLLGRLRLSLCYHADKTRENAVFFIRDSTESPGRSAHLSPSYFSESIMPYLQAVIELQNVIEASKGQAASEVYITAINAVKGESVIMVCLDGAADAVTQIVRWVNPWREARARVTERVLGRLSEEEQRSIQELSRMILSDVATDSLEMNMISYGNRMSSLLGVLSTPHFELSMEPIDE